MTRYEFSTTQTVYFGLDVLSPATPSKGQARFNKQDSFLNCCGAIFWPPFRDYSLYINNYIGMTN